MSDPYRVTVLEMKAFLYEGLLWPEKRRRPFLMQVKQEGKRETPLRNLRRADSDEQNAKVCVHCLNVMNNAQRAEQYRGRPGHKQTPEAIEKSAAKRRGKPRPDAREHAIRLNSSGFHRETNIEKRMKQMLLSLQTVDFRAQYPFKDIGVADFYLPDYNVAIETDGRYWHKGEKREARDARKDALLAEIGIRVLRLTDDEILKNPQSCMRKIYEVLNARR